MKEKNVKHLTKTLAVVSLLVPMSAQPLGIGDLKLHSALNQKLNAEIYLNLAAGENPADVTVRLAPPEKFDQAGVPWNYFLSKIRFKPVVLPNGSIVVKVSSREPLTEPFLDFLLEVVWPQGSQVREFTVLVDPPAAYSAPTSPSAANFDYRAEPESFSNYEMPVRTAKATKKRSHRADIAPHISPQTPTSGEYGPVQNAQTLWSIAGRLGQERNVPTKQMMYALYKANPDAFNNGNMDLLKAGAVLKIPETDAILQSSGKSRDKPVSQPATTPVATDSSKALELVAPADAKVGDTAAEAGSGQPGQDGVGTAAGTGSSDAKDLELQTRIDRLEQQLNMMQQLLALKDQQLAALQNNDQQAAEKAEESAQSLPGTQQQAETNKEITPAQPTTPVEPAPTVVPPQATTEVKPAPAPVVPKPKPVAPVAPPVVEEPDFFSSSTYYLTVGGMTAGIMGLLGWLLWRKRKIESQTNTESMFASASQIKMPDSDSALSVPVMDISSTGAYDVGTVGESSFISDFTPSDFEAFDTDQTDIDPMSEADVYLAYGRYQQAEDLIRQAIKDQPDKDDYKLKLLEIFYANENKDAFSTYAQELVDAGKNADRPFWNKVEDMAKEIIPGSALFGGVASVAAKKGTNAAEQSPSSESASFTEEDNLDSVSENDDDLLDLKAATLPDMELMDEVNSELAEMQLTLPEESDDNGLDFDLGSFSAPAKSKAEPEVAAESLPDIESIDFDLSGISSEDNADNDEDKTESAEPLQSFDFNFDLDEKADAGEKADADKVAAEEPLDMESLESFEFPELADMDLAEKPQQETSPLSLDETASTSDEFDFNFDLDVPVSGSDTKGSEDDMDFGVSDLTDMDEFETKIDLAKAYIDMGDADAAKVIAEEVLAKGSAEQKQAAQALLDELK